jgi:glyoxylase-like metal-dependent hydrolase (beta-lactamase superfamily II)
MQIIPLSEGSFTIDKTKIFVPFEQSTDDLQARPQGSLLVEVQPFVVITKRDVLLLDTGLGFPGTNQLQIHENLLQHGIQPSAITKILLTHLHKDHAGGVSITDKLGHHSLSFPSAQYYVQAKELDYAFDIGFPSYMIDEISLLKDNNNATLLDGDGMIDGYIEYSCSGGHSPYHQVFKIIEDNEIIFFGGDNAPQLQQMKNKFVAKYDYDGRKSMELRQKWWEEGKQNNWTFLFYHDIKMPKWPE